MRYIPHTEQDIASMLKAIGVESVDALFDQIPEEIRKSAKLNLPGPLAEPDLLQYMSDLAYENDGAGMVCFAGGGSYRHHIPTLISQLLLRSEFYTAYTPYQPEISQGTLQAIFEYQTMVARLLEMEVANASLYDGASALAEAVLMASRSTRKSRFLVSEAVNPDYLETAKTYTANLGFELEMFPVEESGRTDLHHLSEVLDDSIAGVIIQSPNAFGVVEDLRNAGKIIGPSKTRFIVAFTEPLAYGMLAGPGRFGADIVCGEGQSFGIPLSYGGPYLGMFAVNNSDVRKLPGRLCGQTVDQDGRPGYVLTLATREQHIRREKATSNICTNQALCALASCIFMAVMGAKGLPYLAKINHAKAEYLKNALQKAGATITFTAPTFNEFVYETNAGAGDVLSALAEDDIFGGLPVSMPEDEPNKILVCATEVNNRQEMDDYVEIVKEFL